ncbi:MAG: cell wall-binding repeat-containing protein [Clostridium sp.]
MKKSSRVISKMLLGATFASFASGVFAVESEKVIREKILAGNSRYESAIEVSKSGWRSSENVVLVNGVASADALTATPYAKMKNAPILLTEKEVLTKATKDELVRLKVKNVTIVGGEKVVSKKVEETLKSMGIEVSRIKGKDRYETSLNIAKNLDVKSIAVVNGKEGHLADAISIAAPSGKNNMAILLTDGKNSLQSEKFIKDKDIENTYVIGGEMSVSKKLEENLKGKRIGGKDRLETNGNVLDEFYKETEIKNIYVAKDGSTKESELVDALTVAPLAAKNNAPVILLGNEISRVQQEFLSLKQVSTLNKVGYGISEKAIENIYEILTSIRAIDVTTIKELTVAIENARNSEIIRFNPKNEIDKDYEIKTNKEITVEIDGNHSGKIILDMPNGDVINSGELSGSIVVNDIKNSTFTNKGKIENIIVNDKDGASIVNGESAKLSNIILGENSKLLVSGNISNIVVDGKNTDLKVNKDSKVENIHLTEKASGANLENKGIINTVKVHEKAKTVTIDNLNGNINSMQGHKGVIVKEKEKEYVGGGSSSENTQSEEKIKLNNAIKEVNDATYDQIAEVIEKNSKILSLNLKEYNSLDTKVPVLVAISDVDFTTSDEIQKTIDKWCLKIKSEDEEVEIKDTRLKEAINKHFDKNREADHKITKLEMESIKELYGDNLIEYLPKEQWGYPEDIHDRGIRSLEGLQYAINIEKLDLSENKISDLTPLQVLKNLTYLEIDRNNLGDLTPLSSLTNLKHLNIYNNEMITDTTPLKTLKDLEWIDLHFCTRGKAPVNAEPLGELTKLKYLSLESNMIEDISFIKNLKNLDMACTGVNHLTDMSVLSELIYKNYVLWEEGKYVGMLNQKFKETSEFNLEEDRNTYTIKDPVKGLEKYIEICKLTPNPRFISDNNEIEGISLKYNKENKEVEIMVDKEKIKENVNFEIYLDYGPYSLIMPVNLVSK